MPEMLSSIADLAWPLAVVVGLVLFSRPLAGLIRSGRDRNDVTIEIGGQRLTFGKLREQQNAVVLDLQRQVDELRRQVSGAPAVQRAPRQEQPSVLWVDDQPENNALLIDQLMTAGATVDLARSTAEGLSLATRHSYNAVISDMGRTEDGHHRSTAGIEFVRELRAAGDRTPVAIFTSSRSVSANRAAAADAGVEQITASGGDLLAFLRTVGVLA